MSCKNTVGYSSIFWDNDWVRRKYYGWSACYVDMDFHVLMKRSGPVTRYLILSKNLSISEIERRLDSLDLFSFLSIVYLHDFSGDLCTDQLVFCGRVFRKCKDGDRLMNIKTFVIDVSIPLELLWVKMKNDNRRMCRKAEEKGITVRVVTKPSADEVSEFYRLYQDLAKKNCLDIPKVGLIEDMFSQGDLVMFIASINGDVTGVNLIYTASNKAYYLYGVNSTKGDGSGQLLQWNIIKYLNGTDVVWYDLGGVSSEKSNDGIFQFKKSLGGELIGLGVEYMYCSLMASVAGFVKANLKPIEKFLRANSEVFVKYFGGLLK